MRVEVVGATGMLYGDGSPVRAASGLARLGAGWLVVQDDATHACHWVAGRGGEPLRLFPPVDGHDVFDEASGTKALKPDLEAAVDLPGGAVLALGSGSTPARMRSVLLRDGVPTVADLTPVYAAVIDALGIPADQLNLEGACVVGPALRWFQRGLPSAGAPTSSVDLELAELLAAASGGDAAAVRIRATHAYDLGQVAGVGLAITDAVTLSDGRTLVSAAAEGSPSTYDDGPVVGSALALLDDDQVLEMTPLPPVESTVQKVEGLALVEEADDRLHLVAVVDADDPAVPSSMLELRLVR